MLDTLIRGATVFDGLGGAPRRADVGVRGGRIVAIGRLSEAAARTIDTTPATSTKIKACLKVNFGRIMSKCCAVGQLED